jgi:isocitrate dehydrogenase
MSAVLVCANPDPVSSSLPAVTIAVAAGDGIGPEITTAVLRILEASGAPLSFHEVALGLKAYQDGESSGIGQEALDAVTRFGVLLKGPVMTPQAGGYKSVNVTLRKMLGLYANVRPVQAYHPFVHTLHPGMDVTVIRENEEDTYAGIEHRQTDEVYQCLKLISRPGCERICRYAFEYARAHGRRRVTCMTKSNIMKLTDGLFLRVFEETAREYPEIVADHMIIDIGAARMASRPGELDVVVTPNLYGDILSDIAAEVSGSIGLAGSANIGHECAMFEAVHGSAPDIAGRNLANPSGLLSASVMMLRHLGQAKTAALVQDAWQRTIEDGIHTPDIFRAQHSRRKVGTSQFADAVIARLGERAVQRPPERGLRVVPDRPAKPRSAPPAASAKQLVGVDVFLEWNAPGRDPAELGGRLESLPGGALRLEFITNRGVQVYPGGRSQTLRSDHWRCRFSTRGEPLDAAEIPRLLSRMVEHGYDLIKTENLYHFDGERGYSGAQGA